MTTRDELAEKYATKTAVTYRGDEKSDEYEVVDPEEKAAFLAGIAHARSHPDRRTEAVISAARFVVGRSNSDEFAPPWVVQVKSNDLREAFAAYDTARSAEMPKDSSRCECGRWKCFQLYPYPSPPADTPGRLRERAQDTASTLVFVDLGLTMVTGEEQCARAVDIIAKRIAAFARAEREAAIEACAGIMRELRRLNLSEQTNVACEMAVEKMLALRDAGGGK